MFTELTPQFPEPTGDAARDYRALVLALKQWFQRLNGQDALATHKGRLWTPAIAGDGTAGTQTYAASTGQLGRYIEIGRTIAIEGRVVMTAKDAATAGNINITGFPLSAYNYGAFVSGLAVSAYDSINLDNANGYTQIGISMTGTSGALFQSGDNVAAKRIVAADIAATTAIVFGGIYTY